MLGELFNLLALSLPSEVPFHCTHTMQIRSRRQATGGGAPTPHGDYAFGDLNRYASIYYSGNHSSVSTLRVLTNQLLEIILRSHCHSATERKNRLESYPCVPSRRVHASGRKKFATTRCFRYSRNLTRCNARPCVNIVNQP